MYEGVLAEPSACADPVAQRCHILRPGGEIAAFRINKRNTNFKPKWPYTDAEVFDCGVSCN